MRYPNLKHSVLLLVLTAALAACERHNPNLAATTSGTQVDLAGDHWLVVNYWAEWCGPCRHEIPELNELDTPANEGTAEAPGQQLPVRVLGVNYDGLVEQKLIDVSDRMGIEFAVLTSDPRERWAQPVPSVLPSTYLVAPGGEFMETLVGPQTRAGILSRIETLASKRSN